MSQCTSCCAACAATPPPPSPSSSQSAYALSNLLAAGTLSLSILPDEHRSLCDHVHADDSWHAFSGTELLGRLTTPDDAVLCRDLEFLSKHRFVSATWRTVREGELCVRIYIVPYDLANVQGKLRVRKDNVLAPARRYLKGLLPRIVVDRERWEGRENHGSGTRLFPNSKDRRTLAEIYGDLASPNPGITPGWEDISTRLLDFSDTLGGLGMRSTLYKYQRRSVAAMLQHELDTRDVPDPLFIPLESMDGRRFYLQPGSMEVLLERPMVAPCRGGILCEELGTGKTVMILALILATLNQLPTPEDSIVDDRPVLTPLSFRHFPSPDCASARRRCFHTQRSSTPTPVPSFVELLLHRARTAPDTRIPNTSTPLGTRQYEHRLVMEEQVELIPPGALRAVNAPFYHHYPGEPTNYARSQRNRAFPGPKRMWLSSATLVVVPANLLSQWDREITKHAECPLRVLILRKGRGMPGVRELATDYDIILMSYTRFTAEAAHKDTSKLYTWDPCRCPPYAGSRVPDCTCPAPCVSPFLQIRWKRLVIDEGHVSATLSTVLTPFARMLSVERRWIVTGTPTTNLLGLGLGKKGSEGNGAEGEGLDVSEIEEEEEEVSNDLLGGSGSGSVTPTCSSPTSTPFPSPHASLPSSPAPSRTPTPQTRIWNKYDREDLNKLGNMITHFVAVPQFVADSRLVSSCVTEPLLDLGGPRPGAVRVLNQVMEMIMIRHRIEDVEEDVVLPPVTRESVLLDLDPFIVKSYNAMQATIAINAVDSQRTDQDYMFHPNNADLLQVAVKNMSQIMFWSVDDELYNVDQLNEDAQKHIDRAIERNTPPEDIMLLYEAFRHIRLAAEDPIWRSMMRHEDVPYRVYYMNQRVFDSWSRIPRSGTTSTNTSFTGLLHADRLLKIYHMIASRPLITENLMLDWGREVVTQDHAIRQLYQESQKKKGGGRSKAAARHHEAEHGAPSLMVESAARKAAAAGTLKEMQKELQLSMARLESLEKEEGAEDSNSMAHMALWQSGDGLSAAVGNSLLAYVRVGSSTSSKLNYIIKEVLEHSPTEKILIFSESVLTLAHVAEALELVKVKFLRFTTQIQPQFREQLVLTFETSERYRVFLMELKHGARGLNLISASRVIFCEPVWQADVESQAIKRAHRIGQTRPIIVKTLAIRGTAEENMVARRVFLKDSPEKLPKLIEEAGMRHYIANPQFINDPPTLTPKLDFPLFDFPRPKPGSAPPPQPSPSGLKIRVPALSSLSFPRKRVRLEDPVVEAPTTTENDRDIMEPPKKKKAVRFE